MLKRIDNVTGLINRDISEGIFPGGELLWMGVGEAALSFCRPSLDRELAYLLDDLSYHITAEELWIADNPEESPLFEILSHEHEHEHEHDHDHDH